jgi:Domain of unknown function (DUF4249)
MHGFNKYNLKIYLTTMLTAAILLNSCIKKLDHDFKDQPQKLAINSILAQDSLVKVYVSSTRSILKTDTVIIDDALVLLYENAVFYDTLSHRGKGLYMPKKNLYPCERCVYTVIVKANGYPDAGAEAKIPVLNINYNLHVTYPYGYNQNNEAIGLIELSLQDVTSQKNYYELVFYRNLYANKFNYLGLVDIRSDDPVLKDEGDLDYAPPTILFSDRLFNGENVTVSFKLFEYGFPSGGNPPVLINNQYVVLRCVSESYYNYKKYLLRHNYNQNNSGSIDDPLHLLFSSEPTNMYSNITNGYGIFAGYTGIMKKAKLN